LINNLGTLTIEGSFIGHLENHCALMVLTEVFNAVIETFRVIAAFVKAVWDAVKVKLAALS